METAGRQLTLEARCAWCGPVRMAGSALIVRMRPGQRIGAGGHVGHLVPESWQLKPHPDIDANLNRDRALRITINESFTAVQSGFAFDRFGNPFDAAGHMPAALLVWTPSGGEPVAFVSYAATNSVLGFVPDDTSTMFHSGRYRVLQ